MKKNILLVFAVGCWAQASTGPSLEYKVKPGPQHFARITYPALGNIELDEGTVEMWVRNDFDPQSRITNRFYCPISYFSVRLAMKRRLSLMVRHTTGRRGKVLRGAKDLWATAGKASGGPRLHALGWKNKGEWRFIAMSWKYKGAKYVRKLYVDGKYLGATSARQERMELEPDARICVGSYYLNYCFAAVDQLRISAVERTPAEIAAGFKNGLKGDKLTLLFDDFTDITPAAKKNGLAISKARNGVVGRIHGSYELIAGKFGQAIKLHVIEENISTAAKPEAEMPPRNRDRGKLPQKAK